MTSPQTPIQPVSRAVARKVPAGLIAVCSKCGERVKFEAKKKLAQVICNVYVKGKWNRVEHYHSKCYEEAGKPHGEPIS